ncbi:MAG: GDYXXLXY domain-containing protein [Rhizobiaceae bacterium]
MMRNWLIFSAILLAVLKIAFLGWIIASRAAILQSGVEVTLKIQPVDPRDLLRGDYVVVNYDIGRIPVSLLTNHPSGAALPEDGKLYVRLREGEDGHSVAVSASLDAPVDAPIGDGEVDILGTFDGGFVPGVSDTLFVDYGIERFYVPEGEGLAIEEDMRERPFAIRAAIGRDGTAQIKALLDEGKVIFEEPIY